MYLHYIRAAISNQKKINKLKLLFFCSLHSFVYILPNSCVLLVGISKSTCNCVLTGAKESLGGGEGAAEETMVPSRKLLNVSQGL